MDRKVQPRMFTKPALRPDHQQLVELFWSNQQKEIEAASDLRNHMLPIARMKKVIRAEEETMMVAADTPVILTKACELFVQELTIRSWLHAEENHRRILQDMDISEAVARTESYDFLIDILLRHKRSGGNTRAQCLDETTASNVDLIVHDQQWSQNFVPTRQQEVELLEGKNCYTDGLSLGDQEFVCDPLQQSTFSPEIEAAMHEKNQMQNLLVEPSLEGLRFLGNNPLQLISARENSYISEGQEFAGSDPLQLIPVENNSCNYDDPLRQILAGVDNGCADTRLSFEEQGFVDNLLQQILLDEERFISSSDVQQIQAGDCRYANKLSLEDQEFGDN